jgi:hypothetical protein
VAGPSDQYDHAQDLGGPRRGQPASLHWPHSLTLRQPHCSLIVGEQLATREVLDAIGPVSAAPIPFRVDSVGRCSATRPVHAIGGMGSPHGQARVAACPGSRSPRWPGRPRRRSARSSKERPDRGGECAPHPPGLADGAGNHQEIQAHRRVGVISRAVENKAANLSAVPNIAPMRSVYLTTYSGF